MSRTLISCTLGIDQPTLSFFFLLLTFLFSLRRTHDLNTWNIVDLAPTPSFSLKKLRLVFRPTLAILRTVKATGQSTVKSFLFVKLHPLKLSLHLKNFCSLKDTPIREITDQGGISYKLPNVRDPISSTETRRLNSGGRRLLLPIKPSVPLLCRSIYDFRFTIPNISLVKSKRVFWPPIIS